MASPTTLKRLAEESEHSERINELLDNPSAAFVSLGEELQPNAYGTLVYIYGIEDLVREPSDDEVKRWSHSEYSLPIDSTDSTLATPMFPKSGPGYLPDIRFMYFLLHSDQVEEVKSSVERDDLVTFWQHYEGEGDAIVHGGVWLGEPDQERINLFHQKGVGEEFELVSYKRSELHTDTQVRYFRIEGDSR